MGVLGKIQRRIRGGGGEIATDSVGSVELDTCFLSHGIIKSSANS